LGCQASIKKQKETASEQMGKAANWQMGNHGPSPWAKSF
jgi:hypothetical protein